MAQTKRKRTRKHRGTAAGTIEKAAHNRSTRGSTAPKKATKAELREARLSRPPSWRSAANKAALASVVFGVLLLVLFKRPAPEALVWTVVVFFFYTPLGYMTDRTVYSRRMRNRAKKPGR
jgi:hypothetical protein